MHTLSTRSVLSNLFDLCTTLTLASAALLGAGGAQAAGPTGLLNDTGQTLCANDGDTLVACDNATTGDTGTRPRQDGRFGRDVASPTKVGGGAAGFDFTRICFNGAPEGTTTGPNTCTGTLVANLGNSPSSTPSTDWACTRDNITNLIWSLQRFVTAWSYSMILTPPDEGHNSVNRCGFSTEWRVPKRRELLSIVHNGVTSGPMVDTAYFPPIQDGWYWSFELISDTYAWGFKFNEGGSAPDLVTTGFYLRLVRSGP